MGEIFPKEKLKVVTDEYLKMVESHTENYKQKLKDQLNESYINGIQEFLKFHSKILFDNKPDHYIAIMECLIEEANAMTKVAEHGKFEFYHDQIIFVVNETYFSNEREQN